MFQRFSHCSSARLYLRLQRAKQSLAQVFIHLKTLYPGLNGFSVVGVRRGERQRLVRVCGATQCLLEQHERKVRILLHTPVIV